VNERPKATTTTFGDLLKRLRKRAGMTQDDLAAATGYSRSLIAALERNLRLPAVDAVIQIYLPALGLQDEPRLAAQLVELAALARGERPPSSLSLSRERRVVLTEEEEAAASCWPIPPTEILGRDVEIARLCNRLLGHHGRLLTLLGPPGVGKTRFALAMGAQLQSFYRDGACFVPLAAVSNPELVAATLVSALKLPEGSARPPHTRLVEHLRRKEVLLVLDNFEQLVSAASPAVELVAELLAECPGLRLLVTSRERLHLRAEQRYHVQPLGLPAAVDLFVQRCAAVDAGFVLTDANHPTIEAICEQVDRLPLALELCAAQIDLLSPAELLADLRDHRLERLVGGAQDLPPRQRTLRKAIGYSYNLLDDAERQLFRSLGVFVGGCALEEIAAVGVLAQTMPGPSLSSTLHALIGKSLVRAETTPGGATRYLLLETIREFALEQAETAGEEDLLRQRHVDAYLQLFRTADSHLRGPEATAWLARLEPEQDNLRAALQRTLDEGCYADTAWLLLAVWWFWFQIGQWHESGRWVEQLLPHRDALDADVRVEILTNFHSVARASEEFQPHDRYNDEVLGLLEVCPDKLLHATVWHWIAVDSVNLAEASAAWERSIAYARAAREEPGLGPEFGVGSDRDFILGNGLGSHAYRLIEHGEFARAAPLLMESAQIFQARGSRYEMADSLGMIGRLALLLGDMTKARALLNEAVALAQEYRYQEMVGNWQPFLALVTLYDGDSPGARRLLEDSLRVCLDLKDTFLLARVCIHSAETALWEGELAEAEQWLAQSLTYHAAPSGVRIDQIERLLVAARLATAQGAYLRSAALFGLAEVLRTPLNFEFAGPARRLADEAMAQARAALGPALFDEAFTAGQQLSLEEAFATLLAPDSAAGTPLSLPELPV
jgi:predicted ATPase/DNA-binding XRE family transcriptional regulator